MVSVEASTTRRRDVTFVRATVTNTLSTTQRVVLESTLDGPTWAPEAAPITVPEWTDGVWEGTVEPAQRRGLGFASPAAPVENEDPIDLVAATRAPDAERDADPQAALATLDEWTPPTTAARRDR